MEDSFFFFSLSFFFSNVCVAVWFESVWFLGVIDFTIDLYDFFIFERIFFVVVEKKYIIMQGRIF